MAKFTAEDYLCLEEKLEEIALTLMPDVCERCDEIISLDLVTCPDCGMDLEKGNL